MVKTSEASSHTLSDKALAYLNSMASIAVGLFERWNVANIPAFRVWPAPSPRNARGGTDGKPAQTYFTIPAKMDVSLRTDTEGTGKRKVTRHVVDAKHGAPTTHSVGERAVILLSVLRFNSAGAREEDKVRTTAEMVGDLLRALTFLTSGYIPGVTGKAKDFNALMESINARVAPGEPGKPSDFGFGIKGGEPIATIEPLKIPVMKDGAHATDKEGKPRYRSDWTNSRFGRNVQTQIAQAILDAGLDAEPPRELQLDFAAFYRDRAQTNPYVTGEAKVGKASLKVRVTMAELAGLADQFADHKIPETLRVNVTFTRAELERVAKHVTRAQYLAKEREKSGKTNEEGNLSETRPTTPRAGKRERKPAQASA